MSDAVSVVWTRRMEIWFHWGLERSHSNPELASTFFLRRDNAWFCDKMVGMRISDSTGVGWVPRASNPNAEQFVGKKLGFELDKFRPDRVSWNPVRNFKGERLRCSIGKSQGHAVWFLLLVYHQSRFCGAEESGLHFDIAMKACCWISPPWKRDLLVGKCFSNRWPEGAQLRVWHIQVVPCPRTCRSIKGSLGSGKHTFSSKSCGFKSQRRQMSRNDAGRGGEMRCLGFFRGSTWSSRCKLSCPKWDD